MSLEVPNNVNQAMIDAAVAWNKLLAIGPGNEAKWTKEQLLQLGLIAEVIKHLHNALDRLIKANS
jgi:hypothetical protein